MELLVNNKKHTVTVKEMKNLLGVLREHLTAHWKQVWMW
jgi:aerobic-type carbon monoxide dehydrogenase small subunit (CoxS/CutS family)